MFKELPSIPFPDKAGTLTGPAHVIASKPRHTHSLHTFLGKSKTKQKPKPSKTLRETQDFAKQYALDHYYDFNSSTHKHRVSQF